MERGDGEQKSANFKQVPPVFPENGANDPFFFDFEIGDGVFLLGIEGIQPSGSVWSKTVHIRRADEASS